MDIDLINPEKLKKFFEYKKYNCIKPYSIINKNDTVFVSAGIQPLLKDYIAGKIIDNEKLYVSQPVIRTQYVDSIEEGSSIAFINTTSSCFNNSEKDYNNMINDWYELFNELNMKKEDFNTVSDIYETNWGNLKMFGKRTFHYYQNLEIGDTTFFTNVRNENNEIIADSMCDLGFGLERLRWKVSKNSYYDLYSNSNQLDVKTKAYLSVLSLLAVNEVKPSNKNSGYRARLFSKKLVSLLEAKNLNKEELQYLDECMKYWSEWHEKKYVDNKKIILDEYIRNGNRYYLDVLINENYDNLSKIDINISREEFIKRLHSSGVEYEKIKKLMR